MTGRGCSAEAATGAMTAETTGVTGAMTGGTTGVTGTMTGKTVAAAGPGYSGDRGLDDQAVTRASSARPRHLDEFLTASLPGRLRAHGTEAMALPAAGEDIPRWVHARMVHNWRHDVLPWGWHLMTTMARRWLARASFALMLAAAALVLAVAGWRSLTLAAFAVIGVCAVLAGGYWFLANRGVLRWAALVLVIAAPVLILVAFAWHHLVWVAVVAVALMMAAAGTARAALGTEGHEAAMPAVPAARPRRPFLIMNPRSGGGKVTRFGLQDKAEALGAQVALLQGPGTVDVAALARKAVADGADLLGVAGGDGTQALVAGIAAEHGLPFLVISAGTRNHFALDLGLDRDDPSTCLNALTDGEELRVDLGIIGGRTFVNNASFGAYAEVVRSPAYRDDKRGTTLQLLPDLLSGHRGARLSARAGATRIEGPQALLVSNGPYEMGDVAGLGRRARLDAGRWAWSASGWTAPGRRSGSCAAGTARD